MLPPDPTLDEIRLGLAPLVADNAAFDGWSARAAEAAARALGIEPSIAAIAFPGGPVEMIDAWFASIDAAMAARFTPDQLGNMKVRERITRLVETRLELVAPHREALRRAVAILAMPQNLGAAARLGWRSADVMWRLAGDTATDYNHYTKRAILGSVYAATVTVFLNDESEGWAETRAFLARRIEGIMAFEKAKAKWLGRDSHRLSLSRFIGRLRYPAV
ncbi:COQ9 family protein [Sphingomonas sp. LB-2]|uniref:COQ9 family protein n=1 Tax=Sphingomonas caeni TaxID=2984949 RepID=UPI0022329EB2|nr:COQ9 family protein [Sphingomonas caeni]MCW3846867.1 COQ9 family protein [Sphingomonas caeni]